MFIALVLAILLIYLLYRLIRYICKNIYFHSKSFKNEKVQIKETIKDYNDISEYSKTLPNNNHFIYNNENMGYFDEAVSYINTSKYKYIRDRNTNAYGLNICNVSLQIVRKAANEPVKYLCKYFNIKANDDSLAQLQIISENISRIENALFNLKERQKQIETEFNPPKFIIKHYQKELFENIGMHLPEIKVKYAQYIFEYVSAGGNSSQRTVIKLTGKFVEELEKYISQKIKYRKSAAGQRALMTNSLRNKIKERDNYTCQMCGASVKEQSLLLLEIDHIIPLSKGGLSTEDNLQTLCWRCNRLKSDKIMY